MASLSAKLDWVTLLCAYFILVFEIGSPAVQVDLELPYIAENDFEFLILMYTPSDAGIWAGAVTSGICDGGD